MMPQDIHLTVSVKTIIQIYYFGFSLKIYGRILTKNLFELFAILIRNGLFMRFGLIQVFKCFFKVRPVKNNTKDFF